MNLLKISIHHGRKYDKWKILCFSRKKSPVLDETAFLNPMKGMIIKLKVNVGDSIKKGDVLYVIEAMKMELDVKSDRDGVISRISVEKGDFVEYRDAVMNFE